MLYLYLSISNVLKLFLCFFCISSFKTNSFFIISFIIVSIITIKFSIVSYFYLFLLLFISSVIKRENLVTSILRTSVSLWIVILVNLVLSPLERSISITHSNYFFIEFLSYILVISISLATCKYILPKIKKCNLEFVYSTILTSTFVVYQLYLALLFPENNLKRIGFSLMIIIVSVVLYFLFKSYEKQNLLIFELEKKEIEEKYNQNYVNQISKEYTDIKKFKHDYINILSTLGYYIETGNLEKIKNFYSQSILPTKGVLNSDYHKIDSLQKIKSDSLKSIIAVKLLSAKEKNVIVNLEITDEIDAMMPIKDTTLIRILGIILDNAIEEAIEIEDKAIQVGLFSDSHFVYIIVKNKASENIPPLHVLKQDGFSTKGENRGLGLGNLNDLVRNEENIILSTEIDNKSFIQKLMIRKD